MRVGDYWLEAKQEEIDEIKAKGSNAWIEFLRLHVTRNNTNRLILVVGDVGSGKSYACLKQAELLDKEFHKGRVLRDPQLYAEMAGNPEQHNLKSGSVLIVEEGG